MKAYDGLVEWPEEIRKMLISKIEELERANAVEEAVRLLDSVPSTPNGTAKRLVRDDRDSH
jgi:hypothetical protein